MDTSHMSTGDCLGLAQCLRDSIHNLARGECAVKYRAAKCSASYDIYIVQHFAQQIHWMQHLFDQAGSPIDMTLFREEINELLRADNELRLHNVDIITFDEAAKLLRKSISTVNRWRNQGRCPEMFIRIGAAWYVDRSKLQAD